MLGGGRVLMVALTRATLLEQQRNYATLKDISIRLKSIKNIQKITQSMKMVSAAKFSRAERDLQPARPYGEGAQSMSLIYVSLSELTVLAEFYDNMQLTGEEVEKKPDHLMVAMTSDRGLCGSVHSNINKMIRNVRSVLWSH